MNPAPLLSWHTCSHFVVLNNKKRDGIGRKAASSFLCWHAALPVSRILFELSGAHAGQGRCLTALHSLSPRAVYQCHGRSTIHTPPILCLQQLPFLRINRPLGFQMQSNVSRVSNGTLLLCSSPAHLFTSSPAPLFGHLMLLLSPPARRSCPPSISVDESP